LVVLTLPSYQHKAIAMLICAGAEVRCAGLWNWLSLEDGTPSPKAPVDRNICMVCILRPQAAVSDKRKPFPADDFFEDEDDEELNSWAKEIEAKPLPMEVGCWNTTKNNNFWGKDGIYYQCHDNSTCEWYSNKYIFDAMGTRFDLDTCSPGLDKTPWIPVDRCFTLADDGLAQDWFDWFVWMNAPYGRNRLILWTRKFIQHGNGVALVPERTSTIWYQELEAASDLMLHCFKKIPFITPDGKPHRQFPIGTHLIAIGEKGVAALINAHRNDLGSLSKKFTP
jgi:hypothetical protein